MILAAGCVAARAEPITARAAVSAQSVFVGESFRYQIQISGTENAREPDLSGLNDFTVHFEGGGPNSSTSVTIINGQMTRNVQKSYVLHYQLTPSRAGTLTIPPVTVQADGQTAQTQAIRIVAQEPVEAENFKLRLSLSKTKAFVGEPLMLELIFYYSADVERPQPTLPVADSGDFHVYDPPDGGGQDSGKIEELGGKRFQTMRLRKVLIPKVSGSITIEPATLAFRGVAGYETGRDFFDRRVRRPSYRRFVIPSNSLELEVLDLPDEGRPANFAGHVGEYQISARATPVEVNVGDPITLSISVAGPEYLEHIDLPPLHEQPSLIRDFRVPTEMESGQVNGNFKNFTQTIRAAREDVTEIPPVELPYFDTSSGAYRVARSEPIPISVRPTRVVTADDAEGADPVVAASKEVQGWTSGIAHNYDNLDVLDHQTLDPADRLRSPVWIALLAVPPAAFFLLLGFTGAIRRRAADPGALREKRAHSRLERRMPKAASSQEVMEAFRTYLGDRLRLPPGALTFRDVEPLLLSRGVGEETLREVKAIFDQCEALRYAGGAGDSDVARLAERGRKVAATVERRIR